ncbi:uncharacterized protein LOC112898266 [Panicum hallii]|uniref:uncharacterized protein LOC112898266 n=1 Tax=Panicum hallii TaxID=206008 RepID=UPI000DF4D16F|nr:uncharacterized protein LOC112898266 [Panicum hallii]
MSQPGAGAVAATNPSPSPSPAPPPPVVEWPEGGALTRGWAAALASVAEDATKLRLRPPPDSLIFLPAGCFACPWEEGHGCTAVQRCWPPSRLSRHRCHQEHSICAADKAPEESLKKTIEVDRLIDMLRDANPRVVVHWS